MLKMDYYLVHSLLIQQLKGKPFSPTDKPALVRLLQQLCEQKMKMELKWHNLHATNYPSKSYWVPATSEDVQGNCTENTQGGTAVVNGKEVTVEMNDTVPAKLIDSKTGNVVTYHYSGEGTYTVEAAHENEPRLAVPSPIRSMMNYKHQNSRAER